MSRIILITNPDDDPPTKYLSAWSKLIIEEVRSQKDTLIFELKNKQANKEELTRVIQKEKPQLIVFNGYGSDSAVSGFGREILIKCDDNEGLLKEKIVHSLSCDSGKTLGLKCIKIGTLSYIGYREEFKLSSLGKKTEQEMLDDPVVAFFLKPAFEAVLVLIEGGTTKDAYKRSQEIYKKNLQFLMATPLTEYNTTVASRLYHNLKYQVCLGDLQAKF